MDLTTRVSFHLRAMIGTTTEPPRCVGLSGTVGSDVSCTLYDKRPTPCREFEPSYECGRRHIRCDQARLRHGLPPLSTADWEHDDDRPIRPARPAAS